MKIAASFLIGILLTLAGVWFIASPYLYPITLEQVIEARKTCQEWARQFPEGKARCVLTGGYKLQLKIEPSQSLPIGPSI